ncbi:MAG: hypothetical protein HYV02_01220 [Deltaproteobacteria bacterium]|nr:hypothetical protein [Deltaproteobacteria bacterium]
MTSHRSIRRTLLLALTVVLQQACGGAFTGIETGTPEPLGNAALELSTVGGEKYLLVTDADGNGVLRRVNESGEVLEEVSVFVAVNADSSFSLTVTFADGTVVAIEGTIDESGSVVSINVAVNGTNVSIVVSTLNEDGTTTPAPSLTNLTSLETIPVAGEDAIETGDDHGATSGEDSPEDIAENSAVDPNCVPQEIAQAPVPLLNVGYQSLSEMVWNGSSFGLFWMEGETVYFQKIAKDGTGLTAKIPLLTIKFPSVGLNVAWNGAYYGLVWTQKTKADNYVYHPTFLRVNPSGAVVGTPQPLDMNVPWQSPTGAACKAHGGLAMAGGNGTFGIVWADSRADGEGCTTQLYYTFIDSNGTADPDVQQVTSDTVIAPWSGVYSIPNISYPHIQWNGARFGIAWSHYYTYAEKQVDPDLKGITVYFSSVAEGGEALSPIVVGQTTDDFTRRVTITADGANGFAILWAYTYSYFRKVSNSGVLSEGAVPIFTSGMSWWSMKDKLDGTNLVTTGDGFRLFQYSYTHYFGIRGISDDGVVSDSWMPMLLGQVSGEYDELKNYGYLIVPLTNDEYALLWNHHPSVIGLTGSGRWSYTLVRYVGCDE